MCRTSDAIFICFLRGNLCWFYLNVYLNDTTGAYAHSINANDNYLVADYEDKERCKDKYHIKFSKNQVLPVYYALKGHHESRKCRYKWLTTP